MKVECPSCSQRIEISPEISVSLRGIATFDCPACGAPVPTPAAEEESLAPLAAEQLLMRGLASTASSAGAWIPPEPADLDESIGERYHVTALLGHGGMGAVYKARDTRLDRTVAIKILPEELARNPAILSRFEREAKSLAALDHPNIIKIHDYGFTSGGSPFFVMEFVRGRDIQSLRAQGDLNLRTALTMVSQVCQAIDYAHQRKIIHRDIKPANVMVDEQGRTKVADFGLAKLLETDTRPHHEPGLTYTGQVMGTPAYMAPEQESGAPVDHRTDIYALGVMLYNLLTGTPPRGAWSLPSELAPVDARLDQIVLRALQENPDARYQSASEFRADIDSVISDSGGAALPPEIEPEPLPSSVAGGASTISRRFANKSKTTIPLGTPTAASREEDFLSTARSLNNTVLILGLLVMFVIGGLALFLANRKTGDTSNIRQTISSSETRNTFFSQLVATGIVTNAGLAEIDVIRPYRDGFIGLSKEYLTNLQVAALAEKTGATILEIPPHPLGKTPSIITWIRQNIVIEGSVRVTRDDKPHLLAGDTVLPESAPAAPHRVLLHWAPEKLPDTDSEDSAPALPEIAEDPPPEIEMPSVASPDPPPPEPVIDVWTDIQGRAIEARFLRLEGETLIIDFNEKETRVPFSRLSPESRSLALKRQSDSES